MALATTTVTAVAQADTFVTVASATGIQAGMLARVNGEWMQVAKNYVSGTNVPVQRGLDGSAQVAHGATSNFTFGVAGDFAIVPAAGVQDATTTPTQPAFPVKAYGAAGAIDVRQHIAIINGTTILAMTLANPTKDMDGQMLIVVSNGKAAHTLTYSAGLGNIGATADVGTFPSGAQSGCLLMAVNGFWVSLTVGGSALVFPVFA